MASVTRHQIPGGWSDREVLVEAVCFRLLVRPIPMIAGSLDSPADADRRRIWPIPIGPSCGPRRRCWPRRSCETAASGVRVLELGCGSGLAGLGGLACGLEVTFSDYVPLAVELARENAARNGFSRAKGLVLDWRQPPDDPFDLILAADVLYDRTHLDPLLDACDKLLAAGGEAWFGDAGRGPAEDFLPRALARRWSVVLYDENDAPVDQPRLGRSQRFVLRRP